MTGGRSSGEAITGNVPDFRIRNAVSWRFSSNLSPTACINSLYFFLNSKSSIILSSISFIFCSVQLYPKPKLIKAKNSKPPQFWTEKEVNKILDLAKGKYVYDLLVFALNTGLRAGELAHLRWEDVNLEKGFLVVQGYDIEYHTKKISFEPKNHELRRVKLNFEALNVLRMLRPNSEWTPFCFGNKRGRPRKNNMQRDLRIITRKLGIDKKGQWHCARRTFAVHVLQNGGSVEVVRQLLGHSDLKTTQRYLNVTNRHLDNAVDLINFGGEELETGKVLPFKMTT